VTLVNERVRVPPTDLSILDSAGAGQIGAALQSIHQTSIQSFAGCTRLATSSWPSMRFLVAALIALTIAPWSAGHASADATVTWLGSYMDQPDSGCTWIIALWSDASSTGTAVACNSSETAVRDDGARPPVATSKRPKMAALSM